MISVSGLVYVLVVARSPLSFSFLCCFINPQITMRTPSLAFVLLGLTSAVSAIAVGEPNPATPKAHTEQLEAFCKNFTSSMVRCCARVRRHAWSDVLHNLADRLSFHAGSYWNTNEDSVKTFCGEVKVVTEVINSTGHVKATVQKTELPKDGKVSLPTHLVYVHKKVRKFKLFDYDPKVLKHLSANATTPTRQILKYTKEDTRFKNATQKRLEDRVVQPNHISDSLPILFTSHATISLLLCTPSLAYSHYAGSQRLIETRLTRWLGLKSRASRALVSLPSSSIFHPQSCARTQPLESGSRSVLFQCLIHLPFSILCSYSTP
ncbi:BQ5605_C017g08346 [Microbotryum silenes-dioicae]|uniref:BQ5605_C017g08346 protein n=1 Tax=Microbotryum silenes-dioicae TaxID=796604 RepID=A0A2X0LYG2_9BASI|nr:BQ5605_C017g08346 [Microbotryum silenes-dioicae]